MLGNAGAITHPVCRQKPCFNCSKENKFVASNYIMQNNKPGAITIETTVNASADKVWESFTEPKHITQWCQASDDWHAPYADNDLRVGGAFKTTMAAKDGSFSFDFGGIYSEVKPGQRLAYEMSDGRRVEIDFLPVANGIKIIQRFEPESTNPVEMQQAGWQAILDNFKKYTEQGF